MERHDRWSRSSRSASGSNAEKSSDGSKETTKNISLLNRLIELKVENEKRMLRFELDPRHVQLASITMRLAFLAQDLPHSMAHRRTDSSVDLEDALADERRVALAIALSSVSSDTVFGCGWLSSKHSMESTENQCH